MEKKESSTDVVNLPLTIKTPNRNPLVFNKGFGSPHGVKTRPMLKTASKIEVGKPNKESETSSESNGKASSSIDY